MDIVSGSADAERAIGRVGGGTRNGTYADDDSAVSSVVTSDDDDSSIEEPQQHVLRAMESNQLMTRSISNNEERKKAGVLPRTGREWCIVIFAVVSIVAVAVAVGLGIGFYMISREDGSPTNTVDRGNPSVGDGSGSNTNTSPTSSYLDNDDALDIDTESFAKAIEYHMIAQEISSIASFREFAEDEGSMTSAQQLARDFLVLKDFLPLELSDEAEEQDNVTIVPQASINNAVNRGAAYLKTSTPAYRVVQRFVMSTLYFATNGTEWETDERWVEAGVHECEWIGVTCELISIPAFTLLEALDNPDEMPLDNGSVDMTLERMVTEINLPENNLGGELPMEIIGLPFLKVLGMWSNSIGGELPLQLGNLTHLTSIHLDDNEFVGSIPDFFDSFPDLEAVTLDINGFTGQIPPTICSAASASLEMITLSENNLYGNIPDSIKKCTNLMRLELNSNQLQGGIPAWIGDLVQLENLDLSDNELSGDVPTELSSLIRLKELRLERNSLSGNIICEFEDAVVVSADCRNGDALSCSCCLCI
jgi:Leucine-rich repeat (LRR) protein